MPLKEQQPRQPQTAVLGQRLSLEEQSDREKLWETYPLLTFLAQPPQAGAHPLREQQTVSTPPGAGWNSGQEGFCGNVWTRQESVPSSPAWVNKLTPPPSTSGTITPTLWAPRLG